GGGGGGGARAGGGGGTRARGPSPPARRMGVVEIEPVDQETVHEGRVAQRQANTRSDHGPVAVTGKTVHRRERALGKLEPGRGERNADAVENEVTGAAAHRGGNIVGPPGGGQTP